MSRRVPSVLESYSTTLSSPWGMFGALRFETRWRHRVGGHVFLGSLRRGGANPPPRPARAPAAAGCVAAGWVAAARAGAVGGVWAKAVNAQSRGTKARDRNLVFMDDLFGV